MFFLGNLQAWSFEDLSNLQKNVEQFCLLTSLITLLSIATEKIMSILSEIIRSLFDPYLFVCEAAITSCLLCFLNLVSGVQSLVLCPVTSWIYTCYISRSFSDFKNGFISLFWVFLSFGCIFPWTKWHFCHGFMWTHGAMALINYYIIPLSSHFYASLGSPPEKLLPSSRHISITRKKNF